MLTAKEFAAKRRHRIEQLCQLVYEPMHVSRSALEYSFGNGLEVPGGAGVYFLLHGRFIEYVGKANCLERRLLTHWKQAKISFNRVWWIEVDDDVLCHALEAFYIEAYRPPNNQARGQSSLIDLRRVFSRFPHWKSWNPSAHGARECR